MKLQDTIDQLKDGSLEQVSREALSSYQGANPADVEKLVKWTQSLRDDLVTLIKEIDDEDEVAMTLAINYIELKSRWIAINTKINYQNFRTGSCDPVSALRAAAISQLLAKVESLLSQGDIDQITQFLAEPIRRAA